MAIRKMQKKITAVISCLALVTLVCYINGISQGKNQKNELPTIGTGSASQTSEGNKVHSQPFLISGKFNLTFILLGDLYDSHGLRLRILGKVSTSLLHSFSPQTETHFRSMMLDPHQEHPVYANSPAMAWHQGELVVVMRIWLQKEKWEETRTQPRNSFSDNYLYMQKFDNRLKPVSKGVILGIPTPNQWVVGDGPIEPRLFTYNDSLYMTFNAGISSNATQSLDSTYLWLFKENRIVMPYFEGGSPLQRVSKNAMIRDKHWIPFADRDGELYFVYTFDPLRVMHLNVHTGQAKIVYTQVNKSDGFVDFRNHVRGGTPHVLYKYPYFISITHTTLFDKDYNRIYSACITVLKAVAPQYKIVYKSDPLHFRRELLEGFPIVRKKYIKNPFIFPISLILEGEDSLAFGAHINDYNSVVFRFQGLKKIMDQVMKVDRNLKNVGPPMGTLNNRTRKVFSTTEKKNFLFNDQSIA